MVVNIRLCYYMTLSFKIISGVLNIGYMDADHTQISSYTLEPKLEIILLDTIKNTICDTDINCTVKAYWFEPRRY